MSLKARCPDHVPLLEALGDSYTKLGFYEEGLAIDLQLTGRDSANPTYWYNLACSYARLQQSADALAALERGVELGYDDAGWMMADEDLASIRQCPEFLKLVSRLSAKQPA